MQKMHVRSSNRGYRGVAALMSLFFTATSLAQTAAPVPAPAPASFTQPTLERITQTGAIRLAYRESSVPFSFLAANGKPVGFTIDLCEKVVGAVRTALKLPKLEIQWVAVSAPERLPSLKTGKADLECGNTTNTVSRRAEIAFAVPTFIAGIRILSPNSVNANDLGALDKKTVVASPGTTATALIEKQIKGYGSKITLLPEKDNAQSMAALVAGKAQAWVTDDVLLYAFRAGAAKPADWTVSTRRLTIEPLAIGMRKDDPEFAKVVNGEIRRIMLSGEFEPIYKKWFESKMPEKNINMELPISDLLRSFVRHPTADLPASF